MAEDKNDLLPEDSIGDETATAVSDTEGSEEDTPKLDLEVEVATTSACVRHVSVTIPRTEIDRYFDKQFDDLLPKAEVPGFRIGKAPRRLVENKFRKQVADQVKGSILMDSLTQINEDQDFSAISEPDLDFETVKLPDEGPMKFEFDIEVRPDFDLPDWKGLSLKRPEHTFTEDEVDQRLKDFVGQMSELQPVKEPAKMLDKIRVQITSFQGEEVAEISNMEEVRLTPRLSMGDCEVENFGELLEGKSAGESVRTKVQISEFAANEKLAGQEIEIEIDLAEVLRSSQESVEQLCERMGMGSPDELKKLIKDSMQNQLEYAQRQSVRDQICDLLTESAEWDIPQELLRRQSKRELERAVMEMRRSGFDEMQIRAQENQLRRNAIQKTETLLKEHFILERIAEAENIEDAPEDYDLEIAKIAAQRGDSPRRVRARLERQGQMDAMRNMIIEQKVIDLITASATFAATEYKQDNDVDTAAIDFQVSGTPDAIPEAKYDAAETPKLPGT